MVRPERLVLPVSKASPGHRVQLDLRVLSVRQVLRELLACPALGVRMVLAVGRVLKGPQELLESPVFPVGLELRVRAVLAVDRVHLERLDRLG